MLRAIAIDDEPMALEVLKQFSEKVTFVNVVEYFNRPIDAINYLKNNKVDLIFLDIKMPDINGFDFLRTLYNPPMIVFSTAYSEYAVQGFEVDAIDYLLKPFSLVRFLKTCSKAYEMHNSDTTHGNKDGSDKTIFIKCGTENIKLNLSNIHYVEAQGNYVTFVMADSKILSRLTMNEANAILEEPYFLRIHRSYIVSKKQITKFSKKSLWLGNIELPIGNFYVSVIEKL